MTKEQFSAKILAMERSLYRVAKSLLRNDEDCADAIQNAILKAYGKLHTLKNEDYFKTWVTRIVINESYAILRTNKRLVSYEEYMSDEQTVEEEYSPVFEEITKMKEKYRIPFVLHYVEGYTTAEIAKMPSLSEGAVKTQLFRARNQLKAQLKGVDGYERMEV
ncbi:MAG: sigma-70 family RNA polymerase sigma factor [Roseburia sp.]|nr:sigma-70 family RNA polymerase sigma factor [Roseburia sp.]MCM1242530.1 sigma-70 family RNA polymerase sigma factor [Roseburia sp.]